MVREGFSKIVAWQYRLTRTGGGLKIEVLEYQAEPVVLTPEVLGEFGLVFKEGPARKAGPGKRRGRSTELPPPTQDPGS
jgi:hypothetical protein